MKRLWKKIETRVLYLQEYYTNIYKILNRKRNSQYIYLFGCPTHPNLGDQAQYMCINKWINKYYPNFTILRFHWRITNDNVMSLIGRKIRSNDLVMGHSGYFMVDHHKELPVYIYLARKYKGNKIIILPQTINISNASVENSLIEAFNEHKKITLLCRDIVSYRYAKEKMYTAKIMMYPDIVTTMIGSRSINTTRTGVFLCMRNDGESNSSQQDINELEKYLKSEYKVIVQDTTIDKSWNKIKSDREVMVNEILEIMESTKLVITDRYHGVIFALITSTPVIVVSTNDHKVTSGLQWFPEEYNEYIYQVSSIEYVYNHIQNIMQKQYKYNIKRFYNTEYYSQSI